MHVHTQLGTSHIIDTSSASFGWGSASGSAWQTAHGVASGCTAFGAATKLQKATAIYGYSSDAIDLAKLGGKIASGEATTMDIVTGLGGYVVGRQFSRGCFIAGTPVHLGTADTTFVGTVGGYGAESLGTTSDSLFVESELKWVVASVGLAGAGMLLMSGDKRKSKPSVVPACARARRKPDRIPEPNEDEPLDSYDGSRPASSRPQRYSRPNKGFWQPSQRNRLNQPSTRRQRRICRTSRQTKCSPRGKPNARPLGKNGRRSRC